MKRLFAVVGAVAMICAAVLVRSVLGDSGTSDGATTKDITTVACATELAAICTAWDRDRGDVAVVVEDGSVTLAAIDAGTTKADAWLAPRPWIEVARSEQQPRVGAPSKVIARARVAIVIDTDQTAALTATCKGAIGWKCLGGFDKSLVGIVDPEAGGLPVLGAAASGYFGTNDFARNDFDASFDAWLQGLAAGADEIARFETNPVVRLVTARGTFAALAVLEPDTAGIGARRDRAEVIYPSPVSTADVVLASIGTRVSDKQRDRLATSSELDQHLDAITGWHRANDTTLPPSANQPNGGVLAALLERWREVR
jgi:hypothetical protein